jgi:flagellar biosynthetic protein FliR
MIAPALAALPGSVLSVFLVFCRVGACLMLIPAIGSARVPVRVRLMLSLGASAAVAAALGEFSVLSQGVPPLTTVAGLIAVETGKGLFIGFMARFFFAMLQFMAEGAANAIGLNPMISSAEDGESMPAVAALITITASALFVITDQHLEVLRALVQSYDVMAFGASLDQGVEMINILGALAHASLLSLQVCSPFLVFAITINFVFGLLNKLAPQIPVTFVSAPFIVSGGLMLLYFLSDDIFTIFIFQFSDWLASGQTQ